MKRYVVAFVLAAIFCSSAAVAAPDLAAIVTADLKKALPGYEVIKVDDLTLKVGPAGHADAELRLDRMKAFCDANPDDCENTVHGFAAKVVGMIESQNAPVDIHRLRAGIRASFYVEGIAKEIAKNVNGAALVSAKVAGDIAVLCVLDLPTSMRPILASDLSTLGLSADEAMAACKRNTHAALRPLKGELKDLRPKSFGLLTGQEYLSSYVLFTEDWAELAAKFGGKLIVAVPDTETIIYGQDESAETVDALHTLAEKAGRRSERAVSAQVLRWSKDGWQAVP